MLNALGLALLAAIEPLGVIAFIAVLSSSGGRRNTRGFIIGWVLCACVVALLTLWLHGGGTGRSGRVSTAIGSAGLLQIALGAASLVYLVVRHRHSSVEAGQNATTEEVDDTLNPVGSAMIAAALQGWPVVAAAVTAALDSTDSTTGQLVGVIAVVVVCSSTFVTAHVLAGREPERTASWLGTLRSWIEAHRDRAIDVLLLGAGGWLVLHGAIVLLTR